MFEVVRRKGGVKDQRVHMTSKDTKSGSSVDQWNYLDTLIQSLIVLDAIRMLGTQRMDNFQKYLRIKAAAEFLGVSESTLRNWGRSGKITTYRHPISRYRLYKKMDLENLLKKVEGSHR